MARQNESRTKILEAAVQVFSQKGFFSAGTDEIALQAGVAKGTLYYNFKSKGEIFETLVIEGLEDLHRMSQRTLDEDLTIEEHLHNLIRLHIEYASSYPELTRIFLSEMSAGLDSQIRLRVSRLRNDYLEFLTPLIRQGQELGIILQGDPDLIAHILLSLLNAVDNSGEKHPAETVSRLLEQMLLTGLTPRE